MKSKLSLIAILSILTYTSCGNKDKTATVYTTPNRKCYHMTSECETLYRSKIINEISLEEAKIDRRRCKVCKNK